MTTSVLRPHCLLAAMEVVATGYKGRQNSLVYWCPPCPRQHVVFFQGDMQDTMMNMMGHQAEVTPRHVMEVSRWSEWCLENTCSLLQQKFHDAAIWIIRPCRMLRNLYSAYHHFVSSTITGVPFYSSNHGAILHLHALLTDAVEKEKQRGTLELSVADGMALPVVLMGFSKGCVVLNQITHELVNVSTEHSNTGSDSEGSADRQSSAGLESRVAAFSGHHDNPETTPTSNSSDDTLNPSSKPLTLTPAEIKRMKEFVSHIKAFYWLDSGHSGGDSAWITDDDLLRSLASLHIPVHVDVTPQQVRDPNRKWIGEEEAEFVSKLRQFGASVTETLHFEHEEKSLEQHFRVLKEFKI